MYWYSWLILVGIVVVYVFGCWSAYNLGWKRGKQSEEKERRDNA